MGGGGTSTTEVHTYYYYKIKLAHSNIVSSESITFYNAVGESVYTVAPYCTYVDYGSGIISVPGNDQNTIVETLSTASYWVFYSTNDVIIDYNNASFKISKNIIKNPNQVTVWATFDYFSIVTAVKDIASVIDGRWDTQVQTIFYSEPPTGYNYAIVDLGATYAIQAVDIIAGFFKPDEDPNMKFDIDMRFTLHYSLNGSDYYEIGDKTHNLRLGGGESTSLEEDDLGSDFSCRYIKVLLEKIKKVEYSKGVWPVAITEISAYEDIVISSEATLIRTTQLVNNINMTSGSSAQNFTVIVKSTEGFTTPTGGGRGTAYIDGDSFLYSGMTAQAFTGCSGLTEDHYIGERVTVSLESDTSIYDDDGLLDKLGDRVYKLQKVENSALYTQTDADRLAKAYLKEFYKDHSKITVSCVYAPFINVGNTIRVVDSYNNIARNYFVESVKDANGMYELVLARFPS